MANVTTTTAVDSFMQSADAAAMRTALGLGDSATKAVGTTAGTVAAGNDSRIAGAVQTSRTVSAGTGLTGGGDLSANRTLSVSFGTTFATACRGDDARLAVDANYAVFVSGPTGIEPTIISLPTAWGPSATALADIILCSGGGGGGSGMISPSNLMTPARGGAGGSAGILRAMRGLYMDNNDSLRATIGAGGAGGQNQTITGAIYTPGTDGSPGGGSGLQWNLTGETILDCGLGTSGLTTSGGTGGNSGGQSTGGYVNGQTADLDLTINTPYRGGGCDISGEASSPSVLINTPVAAPWQQPGGGGGGSTDQSLYAGTNGGNAWGIGSTNFQNPNYFGDANTAFHAQIPAGLTGPTTNDLILRFFHRGIGGAGGGGANSSNPGVTCINDIGDLAAGNGAKGAPGCGGGGGGGFTVDQYFSQFCRAGAGGAGGDGFIIVIFHRLT